MLGAEKFWLTLGVGRWAEKAWGTVYDGEGGHSTLKLSECNELLNY